MKKAYEKPNMYVENFELSQSIAAGCGIPTDASTLGHPGAQSDCTCGWVVPGVGVVWCTGPCTTETDEDARFGAVCYNNPNNGVSIFAFS